MDAATERGALHGQSLAPVGDRLAVAVAPDCGRIALRARPTDRDAVSGALGLALPERIGGLATGGGLAAACLGPDEWQILAEPAQTAGVLARLEALGELCSAVDVGHREVGIEVRGSEATLALRGFCALDLDTMPAGTATRTLLDKATAVIVKHAPDHYRIEVWNSFASHVWGLLECSRNEIRLGV